jgi:HEPN domain-containing protein
MRPPEVVKRELVQEWLAKAEEDFRVSEHLLAEDGFHTAIGFHAQQAAEKYLKALLVQHQIEFPKTHNLGELLDLIARIDADLAAHLKDAATLTPTAWTIGYPSDFPDMTEADTQEAHALAVKVREAVLEALRDRKATSL